MRLLWFAVGLAIPAAAVALVLGFRGPDTRGVRVERFTLHSRLVHRDLHEVLVRPNGAGPGRPLLVLLHGRGAPPTSFLNQGLAAALRAVGAQAPNVLLPDGGDSSYWHDRRDGKWGTYLLREAIPAAVARLHADPRRVAIGGESMGGFGALDAARLHPHRFCAVGAHSAALSGLRWTQSVTCSSPSSSPGPVLNRQSFIWARLGSPFSHSASCTPLTLARWTSQMITSGNGLRLRSA